MELMKNALCKPVVHLAHRHTVPKAPRKTKVAKNKNAAKASKLLVRTDKRYIRRRTVSDLLKIAEEQTARIAQIKSLYYSVGIVAEDETKAMSCLLYRFKYCNPYYNLLVHTFIADNTYQAFFDLCWLLTREAKDKSDFKALYSNMQHELEQQTAVNRRQKQKQAYKKLSIDEMDKDLVANDEISKVEENMDLLIILEYIENVCTLSQKKALQDYLFKGKTMDNKQKKRIIKKLKTEDFKMLLKY